MEDRNKTAVTNQLVRAASAWLEGNGFRPVGAEVGVAPGWVADIVGISKPSQTEWVNLKAIRRPPKSPSYGCVNQPTRTGLDRGTVFQMEMERWRQEFETLPRVITALVEVKVSRGDFRRDREHKWIAHPWPANLCYVAMPSGLISENEWPIGWGVMLASPDGATIERVIAPKLQVIDTAQQLEVAVALSVSRDNATRFAADRMEGRCARSDTAQRVTTERFGDIIAVVRDVLAGRPVDESLREHVTTGVPDSVVRELAALQNVDHSATRKAEPR